MKRGKVPSVRPPLACSTTQGAPAQGSGGWRTQKPIRFRRKVPRDSPSMAKVIVPAASPLIAPRQAKSIGPSRCSARKPIRKVSAVRSIRTSERVGRTVPQL